MLRRLGGGEFSTVVECRKADNPETFALKVHWEGQGPEALVDSQIQAEY